MTRKRAGRRKTKDCAFCGQTFLPSKQHVKYCSRSCYWTAKRTYTAGDVERFKQLITDGLTVLEAARAIGKSEGVLRHGLLKTAGLTVTEVRAASMRNRMCPETPPPANGAHEISAMFQKINLPKTSRTPGRPEKTYTKTCPVCRKAYTTKNVSQTYCSLKCVAMSPKKTSGRRRKKRTILRKTCDECGRQYNTKRPEQRYCSDPCRMKNISKDKQRLEERICPNCLKAFKPYCSRIKFCSDKCYRAGVRRGGMVRGDFKFADSHYIRYESSYELAFLLYAKNHRREFDELKRCDFTISFSHKGRKRHYWPDFTAVDPQGKRLLIEVKSTETERKDPKLASAKVVAGKRWCEEKGYIFVYLIDRDQRFIDMCGYVRDHLGPDMLGQINAEKRKRRVVKHCLECGRPIPKTGHGVSHYLKRKYCSQECSKKSPLSKKKRLPSSKHTCPQCETVFYGGRDRKYCSKACYTESQKTLNPKKCPICGKSFRPAGERQKTCGTVCGKKLRAQSRRTLKPRTCETCGEEFQPRQASQKTCSRECGLRLGARTRMISNPGKGFPLLTCQYCGGSFRGQKGRKYCSQDCYRKGRTVLKPRQCPICGRTFKPRLASTKTCGKECGKRLAQQSKRRGRGGQSPDIPMVKGEQ